MMCDNCNKCCYKKAMPDDGSWCYMFNERPSVCKVFQAVKVIGSDDFDYPLQLMTYEQFLKQLRRIGRLIMIISMGMAVSLTCLIILFSPVDIGCTMINAYIGCAFTFFVGLAIYPIKGEE